ncbi:NusG domain II-containing protein [Fusobacterium sp. MFO224]|uniref:NusG domain II-containing protein n=1 Tax=Fusobacterium sp. MFO224 TaxID=3378070 RepID=UPI0038550B30
MKRKPCYFKKFDLIIYSFIAFIFFIGINYALSLKVEKGNKVEIYVNNQLKYVYPLQKDKKDYFVDTDLGGVNVEFIDMKVRVTSSNSPLKICVKQGLISKSGQTIIGIPDKLLIKITGESEEELDGIAR